MMHILAQATSGTPDVMEIVRGVHEFYNQAWGNLLWVVGCIGAVAAALLSLIGLLVPWWLERVRRDSFKLDKETLLKGVEATKVETLGRIEEATNTTARHSQRS